jgi:hypothetical protein
MVAGPKFYHCEVGYEVRLKGGKDVWIITSYDACGSDGHRYVTITHKVSEVSVALNSKKLGPARKPRVKSCHTIQN